VRGHEVRQARLQLAGPLAQLEVHPRIMPRRAG
jgi:hypothetical protein